MVRDVALTIRPSDIRRDAPRKTAEVVHGSEVLSPERQCPANGDPKTRHSNRAVAINPFQTQETIPNKLGDGKNYGDENNPIAKAESLELPKARLPCSIHWFATPHQHRRENFRDQQDYDNNDGFLQ